MKHFVLLIIILAINACSSHSEQRQLASNGNEENIQVYMSPTQGKEAFSKMYDLIREAKKSVNITVYSWSDSGLTKAIKYALNKQSPPSVRVVMRKSVFKKHAKTIAELEKNGAMFKSAKIELHEKFILADDTKLVNSSANFSNGAKTKYSENFVFFDSEEESGTSDITYILREFKREFALIWNSAHDYITADELQTADVLNHKRSTRKRKVPKNIRLYSSSMNYTIVAPRKTDFAKGSVIGLKRNPNKKNQIWTVKDQIIKTIDEAKLNIFLNINHFNLKEISDALIRAVKRGVDVRLVVDSQEFKTYLNNKEMTPQFVQDFVELQGHDAKIPVRVKFYSFVPHHSSWSLDHHKYIMVDYDLKDASNTILLTGSYNYSKTAEHSKFDNQVHFQGNGYTKVFNAFHDEFQYLWSLERSEKDEVKSKMLDYFRVGRKGLIPLHTGIPFSLTWKEAKRLKSDIAKVHPESKTFYKFKHCMYFNPKTKVFLNRDRKTQCK